MLWWENESERQKLIATQPTKYLFKLLKNCRHPYVWFFLWWIVKETDFVIICVLIWDKHPTAANIVWGKRGIQQIGTDHPRITLGCRQVTDGW